MSLPELTGLDVTSKKVLLRIDSDVNNPTESDQRIISAAETIQALLAKRCKVIVLGHKGRPEGKIDDSLSLSGTAKVLSGVLGTEVKFVNDVVGPEAHKATSELSDGQVIMLENLRFNPGEESNDEVFAKSLSELGEVFVNDAFASSHREHASIVGIPKFLPSAIGLRFVKEIWNLNKVLENPARPLLFIVSGLKKDKLDYINAFEAYADKILVGGRLPELMGDRSLESVRIQNGKVIVGNLLMDKEDITLNTIDVFVQEVAKAATIVVSGPVGRFEDEGHRQGTDKVFSAVINNKKSFKVAGGGDTEDAIRLLKITNDFDWVSVGGGAMLEYLSKKTLPGFDAIAK